MGENNNLIGKKRDYSSLVIEKADSAERPDFSCLVPRYSRQMLLPQIGPYGQKSITSSSILVVGAGGIGSSLILYLAGAGIGRLTIVDFDVVELSNLHRQVIHNSANIGMNKALSACIRIREINDAVQCNAVQEKLTFENVLEIINSNKCDLIIDCTDNQMARYILNDACVLSQIPLIHGSAIGLEGQVMVFLPYLSPCYRCLYPIPAKVEGCRSCANSGVLGPVPGLIGSLQAIEAIKIIIIRNKNENNPLYSNITLESIAGCQTYYDAITGEFQRFILSEKNPNCKICSSNATIKTMLDAKNAYYESIGSSTSTSISAATKESTGTTMTIDITSTSTVIDNNNSNNHNNINGEKNTLHGSSNNSITTKIDVHKDTNMLSSNTIDITVTEFSTMLHKEEEGIILDVRSALQYDMIRLCPPKIPKHIQVINYPYAKLIKLNAQEIMTLIHPTNNKIQINDTIVHDEKNTLNPPCSMNDNESTDMSQIRPVYCICRRGVESMQATKYLQSLGLCNVYNVTGGLTAWARDIDPDFTSY